MPINFPNFGLKQVNEYSPEAINAFGLAFIKTFQIPSPSQPNLMPNYLKKCGEFFIQRLHDLNTRAPEELCGYLLLEADRLRMSIPISRKDFSFQNNLSIESWFFQSSHSLGQLHERLEQNLTKDMEKYQNLIEKHFVNNDINLCSVLHQAYTLLRADHFKINETITLVNVTEENLICASLDIISRLNQFDYMLADLERKWGLEIISYLLKANLGMAIDLEKTNDLLSLYENCETSDEINELTLNIIEKHILEPFKKQLQSIREEIDKFKSSNEIRTFEKIFNSFPTIAEEKLSADEIAEKITFLHTLQNTGFTDLEILSTKQQPVELEQKKLVYLISHLEQQDCLKTFTSSLSDLVNTEIDLTPLYLILDKLALITNFYVALSKQPLTSEEIDAMRQTDNFLKENKLSFNKNSTDYEQIVARYLKLIEASDIEKNEYQKIVTDLDNLITVLNDQKEKLNKYIEKLSIYDSQKDSATLKVLIKICGIESDDIDELSNLIAEQAHIIHKTLRDLAAIEEDFPDSAANSSTFNFEEYQKESKKEETEDHTSNKRRRLNSPHIESTKEEQEEEEFSSAFSL